MNSTVVVFFFSSFTQRHRRCDDFWCKFASMKVVRGFVMSTTRHMAEVAARVGLYLP